MDPPSASFLRGDVRGVATDGLCGEVEEAIDVEHALSFCESECVVVSPPA